MQGCLTLPDAEERKHSAMKLAADHGWTFRQWQTSGFVLAGFGPLQIKASSLRIYIEGDGLAWVSSRRPSKNPTPVRPVALELALLDAQPSVYLARPCQYVTPDASCAMKYWTSHRYGEEVIESTSNAISAIKKYYGVQNLELLGFSGGAAVAALVAARRDDVTRLVTVAGNMDHVFWTNLHRVSPLTGSLNPADFAGRLSKIPQVHFVGQDDDNVSLEVLRSYQRRIPETNNMITSIVPDFDHQCCWADGWKSLLKQLDEK